MSEFFSNKPLKYIEQNRSSVFYFDGELLLGVYQYSVYVYTPNCRYWIVSYGQKIVSCATEHM